MFINTILSEYKGAKACFEKNPKNIDAKERKQCTSNFMKIDDCFWKYVEKRFGL